MFENNMRIMKSDVTRLNGEIKSAQMTIKENNDKIKINK